MIGLFEIASLRGKAFPFLESPFAIGIIRGQKVVRFGPPWESHEDGRLRGELGSNRRRVQVLSGKQRRSRLRVEAEAVAKVQQRKVVIQQCTVVKRSLQPMVESMDKAVLGREEVKEVKGVGEMSEDVN